MNYLRYKYLLDWISALIILTVAFPIFLILALLIWVHEPNESVFFIQKRTGLIGKSFHLIKFRTLSLLQDSQENLLPDEERTTKLGSFLRRTSLDELPQLFNVLKGEMSLIGPRPFLPEYLPLYSEAHRKRHQVKPGITGWAQVNGRNGLDWSKKFDLDVEYVEKLSLGFDLKILLLTLKTAILAENISHPGTVSMPRFAGYK